MGKVEFPEWAKPGEKVLSVRSRQGRTSFNEGIIKRLTATRIIVDFGASDQQYANSNRYVNSGRWLQYGNRSEWHGPEELIHAESTMAKTLYEARNRSSVKMKAQIACSKFDRGGSLGEAKDAAEKLAAYIKIMEE